MAKKRKPAKAKPRPRTRRTPKKDWTAAYLENLRNLGNVRAACEAAGIGKSTVYDRMRADDAFAVAAAEALDDATDRLEQEARRRAHDGVPEPVFHQGDICGHVQRYSDTLLIFLLKAHRPERFRERYDVKHSGTVRHAVAAEDMSDDDLAAIAAGEG